ncbi:replication initiation protein, partial [Hoylesella timonensis]
MARTIKGNKNVVQSYTLTTSRYKFTAYEKRILYRIVEFAQDEIKGIMIRDNLHKIDHSLFGRELTMPVTDILKNERDENYTKAKAAFSSLQKKTVVYEDEKVWESTQIILGVKLEKNNGMVKF